MTHRKRHSTRKMEDYQKNKLEVAQELGINGSNNTEVNAEIASQGEPKYNNKTITKRHNLHNKQKTTSKDN